MAEQSFCWSWRHAVLKSGLPKDARHLLHTLGCFMNEMGESCYPSIDTIVECSGMSRTTVKKYLDLCEDAGWLERRKVRMLRRGANNQGWNRNEYAARFPDTFSLKRREEDAVETGNLDPDLEDDNAQKGGSRGDLRCDEGRSSDEKGRSSADQKAGRVATSNSPENQSSESLHPARGRAGGGGDGLEPIGSLSPKQAERLRQAWQVFDPGQHGSADKLNAEAVKLTEPEFERATDAERIRAYRSFEQNEPGDRLRTFSTFIAKRKFDMAEVDAEMEWLSNPPLTLKPFGRDWMAHRLWLLAHGPKRDWKPTPLQQKLIDGGKADLVTDDRRRAEHWLVTRLDLDAEAGRAPVLAERERRMLFGYEKWVTVARGTEEWDAWAAWHHERDWPWINPPAHVRFVWVPVADPLAARFEIKEGEAA